MVNDDKVINLEGELRRDVSMRREVGVHTTVMPEVISSDYDNTIKIMVSFFHCLIYRHFNVFILTITMQFEAVIIITYIIYMPDRPIRS